MQNLQKTEFYIMNMLDNSFHFRVSGSLVLEFLSCYVKTHWYLAVVIFGPNRESKMHLLTLG